MLVPGPGAVSPAGGWHSATVWAQRGVAHHLTHLYQQAVRAARHTGPRPRHQPRPAEGWLASGQHRFFMPVPYGFCVAIPISRLITLG